MQLNDKRKLFDFTIKKTMRKCAYWHMRHVPCEKNTVARQQLTARR